MSQAIGKSQVFANVAWTACVTVAATALFHYHLLVYLLLFVLVVLGGGVPWMISGSSGEKRLARIAVIGTTLGGAIGVLWLLYPA